MKEEELRAICIDKAIEHLKQKLDDWEDSGNPPMESPIERMLYAALVTSCITENLSDGEPDAAWKKIDISHGLLIHPQHSVGKYFVDFLVEYRCWVYSNESKKTLLKLERSVVVECDGHGWHDRSEKDRRREKERDRFLQKKGFKVFRYTGKEITDDPFKVAEEIITEVTVYRKR